jgi:hypothetical protein
VGGRVGGGKAGGGGIRDSGGRGVREPIVAPGESGSRCGMTRSWGEAKEVREEVPAEERGRGSTPGEESAGSVGMGDGNRGEEGGRAWVGGPGFASMSPSRRRLCGGVGRGGGRFGRVGECEMERACLGGGEGERSRSRHRVGGQRLRRPEGGRGRVLSDRRWAQNGRGGLRGAEISPSSRYRAGGLGTFWRAIASIFIKV